ncbi:hypothetical protein RDI61_01800 [Pseudomonas plecoglossicida]|uniref:hypothetical protein n=1 Tax=Pseudomonas putida group TaxID=136845 RepID=UPI0024106FED|nr:MULTISPECIES: hypothetical protein [Pseudomonas putida group]MDQ7962786.1 hypothetical protein [Pseudomonas plecoglossicida]WFG05216.1 hypothetical protein P3X84_11510 [Pseudomonas putida]
MFKKIHRLFVALTVAAIAGCASGPTPEQIANADYGTPINQDQAEVRVKEYFDGVLKDPDSAKYKFSPIQKSHIVSSAWEGRQLYAGYVMTVKVNAKNSYGGYTGNEDYVFLFHNGELTKGLKASSNGIPITLF